MGIQVQSLMEEEWHWKDQAKSNENIFREKCGERHDKNMWKQWDRRKKMSDSENFRMSLTRRVINRSKLRETQGRKISETIIQNVRRAWINKTYTRKNPCNPATVREQNQQKRKRQRHPVFEAKQMQTPEDQNEQST